jgi:hypothetical protein
MGRELSYRPVKATLAGGIDFLESIPGLLKSLKIRVRVLLIVPCMIPRSIVLSQQLTRHEKFSKRERKKHVGVDPTLQVFGNSTGTEYFSM